MKAYLGDSVYIEIKDNRIILTTDNGEGPSNTIILDADVYNNLIMAIENYKKLNDDSITNLD